jgi:hypothetical protein
MHASMSTLLKLVPARHRVMLALSGGISVTFPGQIGCIITPSSAVSNRNLHKETNP